MWQPALRCITATYYDKARTERNGNDLRGADSLHNIIISVLLTKNHHFIFYMALLSLLPVYCDAIPFKNKTQNIYIVFVKYQILNDTSIIVDSLYKSEAFLLWAMLATEVHSV